MMIKALLTSMMLLAAVTTATAQRDFKERDEFNQTYQLEPGARVEVSSIRGSVKIVNSDGPTALVQIIRTARTRADLEYHKVEVKQTGNSLVVRGVQEPEERRERNIQVNHQVILTLPRRVELSINSISGSLNAGEVDGPVRVNSISGSVNIGNLLAKLEVNSVSGSVEIGNVGADVRVSSVSGNVGLGEVNGTVQVSSVSGSVKTTLVSLSPEGIRINSVSGSVEIAFKNDVNAEFNAQGISGQVYLDVPNDIREREEKSPNVRARIGAGGTTITVTSVSGNVRLTRS
jgi:hypothetical protein